LGISNAPIIGTAFSGIITSKDKVALLEQNNANIEKRCLVILSGEGNLALNSAILTHKVQNHKHNLSLGKWETFVLGDDRGK
jgi:hypothetical protein